MRAILLMFDSLKKDWLPPYGGDIIAPNFQRLAEKTVVFDHFYVGSLPCMPARRELHTGRYNFMHSGWSPLEPFDDSVPQILREKGIYTHLVSDHHHYWREGAGNYHGRFSSYEHIRGQEGDFWKGEVDASMNNTTSETQLPPFFQRMFVQDTVNRRYMNTSKTHPLNLTFDAGLQFINTNQKADNWFLQLECFDPHEPFYTFEEYQKLYKSNYQGRHIDWPLPGPADQDEEYISYIQNQYKALVSMIDDNLGRLLDTMDENNMWMDTMLIVNTDHGLLLSEHDWWSKGAMPAYNEIANIPFFMWDPRIGKKGVRRSSLAQNIDVAATLLDAFGLKPTEDMQGKPLTPVLQDDTPVHETVLFGYHGGMANVTDGRYLYMRAPVSRENAPLYEYTLMPARMGSRRETEDLQDLELAPPFRFTKGCKTLKINTARHRSPFNDMYRFGSRLYDLKSDPGQKSPLDDPAQELTMIDHMLRWMKDTDAPQEQYQRLGIWEGMSLEDLINQQAAYNNSFTIEGLTDFDWTKEAANMYLTLVNLLHGTSVQEVFREYLTQNHIKEITVDHIYGYVKQTLPKQQAAGMMMMLRLSQRLC